MRPLPIIAIAFAVIAGCTSNDNVTDTGAQPTTVAAPTVTHSVDGSRFDVESLGLTFRLPDTFVSVDDPEYVFFARSMSPQSLFTIDEDTPGVTDYAERPGETVSERDLGEVDAVVVTNADIEGGLPSGISANEFLVSNGEQSFSVIMSAPSAALPELWDVFVDSVSVGAAD